jgi:hypothetical protein
MAPVLDPTTYQTAAFSRLELRRSLQANRSTRTSGSPSLPSSRCLTTWAQVYLRTTHLRVAQRRPSMRPTLEHRRQHSKAGYRPRTWFEFQMQTIGFSSRTRRTFCAKLTPSWVACHNKSPSRVTAFGWHLKQSARITIPPD